MKKNGLKLNGFLGIVYALGFITLGVYLLQNNDTPSIIIGIANVLFFGALLIYAIYNILKK